MQHDWMQWIPCSLVKCTSIKWCVFHASWINAVYSMQHEEMEHYWMQGILCSMIECCGFLQNYWMQWIFCNMSQSISDLMQWIPCSVIDCWEFHSLWRNGSRLCAVESMQRGQMHLDGMQWILCSMAPCNPIECRGFHAAWWNASWLNAVYTMQHG